MRDDAKDETSKVLRRAAYWLGDYARAFNGDEPGVRLFRAKLLKLSKECRTQSLICPECGERGTMHVGTCMSGTTPPPFGAGHS